MRPDLSRLPLQFDFHVLRFAVSRLHASTEHVSKLSARPAAVKTIRCEPEHELHRSISVPARVARMRAVHAPFRTETKRRGCSISEHRAVPRRRIPTRSEARRRCCRADILGISACIEFGDTRPPCHAPRRSPWQCSVCRPTGTINAFPTTRSLQPG